ncbi:MULTISPECIES: hypothetical protein [unclassified Brevundimonas]|jgi:hypothetical protein|uniref:hypothetical protein n=1 Tax=unclassified Brevundimonas TaxID=2622653 RepID=UPI0025C3B997|nr:MULTISPECIES: hypothetical protein [unclassified Brevundimonas]
MKKPYQTYSQRKLEELIGPDPEVARQRRSEAAKKGWADRKSRARDRKLDQLETILEIA